MEEEIMKEIYSIKERQCYSEVYDIINFLDEDLKQKIPKKWIEFLEKTKMNNYITTINPYMPLEMQKINKQSKLIISYLYIKYLSDDDEKVFFVEKENLEKNEKMKKYENLEQDIWAKNKMENINKPNNKMIIAEKENFFIKLKRWFFKFLKK